MKSPKEYLDELIESAAVELEKTGEFTPSALLGLSSGKFINYPLHGATGSPQDKELQLQLLMVDAMILDVRHVYMTMLTDIEALKASPSGPSVLAPRGDEYPKYGITGIYVGSDEHNELMAHTKGIGASLGEDEKYIIHRDIILFDSDSSDFDSIGTFSMLISKSDEEYKVKLAMLKARVGDSWALFKSMRMPDLNKLMESAFT